MLSRPDCLLARTNILTNAPNGYIIDQDRTNIRNTRANMTEITTTNRLTILLGRLQATTGQRITLRGLAARAGVPKDLVYRIDAGEAR